MHADREHRISDSIPVSNIHSLFHLNPGATRFVYDAAHHGQLQELKLFLENFHKNEVDALISFKTHGATPLIIAASCGQDQIVEYLVEECHADIELSGNMTFGQKTVRGASPLWCAVATGKPKTIDILISSGADVNSTTSRNSSVLRAACYHGSWLTVLKLLNRGANFNVANNQGHTCLMMACLRGHFAIVQLLVSLGADVSQRSVQGSTAFHESARIGDSMTLNYLLAISSVIMTPDTNGISPLLLAAQLGNSSLILATDNISCLIRQQQTLRDSLPMSSNALHSMPSPRVNLIIHPEERITVYELLGATSVDKYEDLERAYFYWVSAMDEKTRLDSNRCSVSSPNNVKTIMPSKLSATAYDRLEEANTMSELHSLRVDSNKTYMQALLIRERILGTSHPDTTKYIQCRGAKYARLGEYDRSIKLWMYGIQLQQQKYEPLHEETQISFQYCAELYNNLTQFYQILTPTLKTLLTFKDLFTITECAVEELKRAHRKFNVTLWYRNGEKKCGLKNGTIPRETRKSLRRRNSSSPASYMYPLDRSLYFSFFPEEIDFETFDRPLNIIIHLLSSLVRLIPKITQEEHLKLRKLGYGLIKLNLRNMKGQNLLHMSCHDNVDHFTFPAGIPIPQLAIFLLDCGILPNVSDDHGDTPLHIVARTIPFNRSLFLILLNRGAHVDTSNVLRVTPFDFFQANLTKGIRNNDIREFDYISLKCLAARSIMKNSVLTSNVESLKPDLSRQLRDFVLLH